MSESSPISMLLLTQYLKQVVLSNRFHISVIFEYKMVEWDVEDRGQVLKGNDRKGNIYTFFGSNGV